MSIGGKSLHKKDWLKLGGVAAAAVAAPYLAGLLSPAAAAAGAGVGAASAGGAAAGAGGIAGGTAALFGPELAAASAANMLAPAATPMLTGFGSGAALADFGAGTAGMFGAGSANAGLLGGLGVTPGMSASGMTLGKGLDALQKAQKFVDLAQGPQKQQQVAPMQRSQPQMMSNSDVMKLWKQIYGGTA